MSVTQQFNTATRMGRLVLNILLSFAQFEREIIGERIRDKIAAQRAKANGRAARRSWATTWTAPAPAPSWWSTPPRRPAFARSSDLYLSHGGLLPVVEELTERGWRNKAWKTKDGRDHGRRPFDKVQPARPADQPAVHRQDPAQEELYAGEHEAIVDADGVRQGPGACSSATAAPAARTPAIATGPAQAAAVLQGLRQGDGPQVHRPRGKRYRYYTCTVTRSSAAERRAQPKSLPAAEIERVVVDRIRCIARDKRLVADVVQQAEALAQGDLAELKVERRGLQHDLARYHAEIRRLATETPPQAATTARIADLYDQAARAETRLAEVRQLIEDRESEQFDEGILASAFADFDATWNALSPREQAQALQLLVARVEYDVAESTVAVTFHETGIRALGRNLKGEAA